MEQEAGWGRRKGEVGHQYGSPAASGRRRSGERIGHHATAGRYSPGECVPEEVERQRSEKGTQEKGRKYEINCGNENDKKRCAGYGRRKALEVPLIPQEPLFVVRICRFMRKSWTDTKEQRKKPWEGTPDPKARATAGKPLPNYLPGSTGLFTPGKCHTQHTWKIV